MACWRAAARIGPRRASGKKSVHLGKSGCALLRGRGVTDWPMMLEWKLLALGDDGGQHPRLPMGAAGDCAACCLMPDAAAASCGAVRCRLSSPRSAGGQHHGLADGAPRCWESRAGRRHSRATSPCS